MINNVYNIIMQFKCKNKIKKHKIKQSIFIKLSLCEMESLLFFNLVMVETFQHF